MRKETSGVHKMEIISWVSEDLLDSQEGLCANGLFSELFGWLVSELVG
jgi:hypothetical protein